MANVFIEEVYKITGVGIVPVGRVEKGILTVGMRANIQGRMFEIASIEKQHESVHEASVGDDIGLCLKLMDPDSKPKGFFAKLFGANIEGLDLVKRCKGKVLEFS